MSQFRINPAVVREELVKLLDNSCYWDCEEKEAEKQLCYNAGAMDMANAIIRRYEGGNTNA